MTNNTHLTWAEIDLGAVKHNIQAIKSLASSQAQVMAVVKANAYGHGALPVARAALQAGATWLAVNRVNEGAALREAGIEARILVLGYCPSFQAADVVRYRLTPTVTTLETARALAKRAANLPRPFPVHLKIDSGMGRFGLLPDEVVPFARALQALPVLHLEGIFSHFAVADESDPAFSQQQLQIFRSVLNALQKAGIAIPLKHLANSAAAMRFPDARFNLLRLGIAMYGLRPSGDVTWPVSLRPAMTLKTRLARVRTLPAGASVGYGRTYIASAPTPIGLASLGYGDGYPRLCSNRGAMLLRGQRAPIAGRVSMDQTSLDISGIAGAAQDDEVVAFGKQGEAEITVDEVAAWAETINYEIVTGVAARVPRIYWDNKA